jgi:3-oxoacyl-[acyl-carrier protein] reductase
MSGRLQGKVAVITGAGGDLMGATASLFAAEGASVVVHDINEAAARARVDAIKAAGGEAHAEVCDVTDSSAVEAMFDRATSQFGLVDVLVSGAGTSGSADWRDEAIGMLGLNDDDWRRLLSIHLDGAFFCSRAMVSRLLPERSHGAIVCISSIAGLAGYGDMHYSTAKGGLLGFVRAVARMYGAQGIRANAVCPGVIAAGMTKAVPDAMLEPLRMMTPAQKYGTADDIAQACLYLASDESGFVTGQALSPNGGLVIG